MQPNHNPNRHRRTRALSRLDTLTTGTALAGAVATLGLGFVAAQATHAPGASSQVATDATAQTRSSTASGQAIPSIVPGQTGTQGTNPAAGGGPSGAQVAPASPAAPVSPFTATQPPVTSSRPAHTATGGSH